MFPAYSHENLHFRRCPIETSIWGFPKMVAPAKTIGFNTSMVIHDLDDLGVPHDLETSICSH